MYQEHVETHGGDQSAELEQGFLFLARRRPYCYSKNEKAFSAFATLEEFPRTDQDHLHTPGTPQLRIGYFDWLTPPSAQI